MYNMRVALIKQSHPIFLNFWHIENHQRSNFKKDFWNARNGEINYVFTKFIEWKVDEYRVSESSYGLAHQMTKENKPANYENYPNY